MYACGNLYKSDSPWIAVSSTLKGYKAFVQTLAEPTPVERMAAGLPGGEAEALLEKEREKELAAAAAAAKKNNKKGPLAKASGRGKGKGKGTGEVEVEVGEVGEVGEDRLREERMTRARLEEDLKDMAVYEKVRACVRACSPRRGSFSFLFLRCAVEGRELIQSCARTAPRGARSSSPARVRTRRP